MWVSILVLLEIGLGETYPSAIQQQVYLFQSLFCWKSVWEFEFQQFEIRHTICFNPCFVGNRSGRRNAWNWNLTKIWFQSLFCWKSVWERKRPDNLTRSPVCFNPCFVGNRSGRLYTDKFLFFRQPVSILVLLEIGLGVQTLKAHYLPVFCFNPCFVGNRSGRLVHWY